MNLSRQLSLTASSLLLLLAGGCADSAPFDGLEQDGDITIQLSVPGSDATLSTRSPKGGENGDGSVEGFDYENSVNDANIFFYVGSGLNESDETEVTGVYISPTEMAAFTGGADNTTGSKKINIQIRTYQTDLEKNGVLAATTEISFITLLNAGADLTETLTTLKKVREYNGFEQNGLSSSTTQSGGKYGNFVMTTAYDAPSSGKVKTDGITETYFGSNRLVKDPDDPTGKKWKGATTVQRLCARVELAYTSENVGASSEEGGMSELVYSTASGNKVHITNILPINFMSKPSYLLRKVTSSVPATWDEASLGKIVWGGIESTVSSSGVPSNYVIEPSTLLKANGNPSVSDWYGESAASSVISSLSDSNKGVISSYQSKELSSSYPGGCDRITIIGYPDENIQSPGCYSSSYITGIGLRGVFQPTKVMSRSGETFTSVTLSDEEWDALSSAGQATFWRYQPTANATINDASALYFLSEADVLAYQEAHGSDMATITRFDDGVCYYTVWVKHYNNTAHTADNADPKTSQPMEYAVVRNNIYSLELIFSGPGDPTPTLREPDTMMSRIFVRQWNVRTETNPLQF